MCLSRITCFDRHALSFNLDADKASSHHPLFAMNRFHLLSFAVFLGLSFSAFGAEDLTVVPGKRVGPITALSSLSTLQALFGKDKVKAAKLSGAEGEELDGAILFKGTDRELQIIWDFDAVGKRISDIRILGKAWRFESGLKLGLSVEEVQQINGKPFKVSGFGWDYGGYADFEGGKLAEGVSVRFEPTERKFPNSVIGEVQLLSTNLDLMATKPVVDGLTVVFPRPE